MAERRSTRRQRREARAAASVQPKAPQRRQKATGWRVPLLFCAVIGLVSLVGLGYRSLTAPPPLPLNAELVEIAANSRINLDGDEEGRRYKEELVAAGRGFSPAYVKDDKVISVALDAVDAGRIDVLVTAVQVLRDGDKRTELLQVLADEGMKHCKDLPWAVFAVRNLTHEYATAMDLTRTLNARYEECKREMPNGWPVSRPAGTEAEKAGAKPAAEAPAADPEPAAAASEPAAAAPAAAQKPAPASPAAPAEAAGTGPAQAQDAANAAQAPEQTTRTAPAAGN